MAQWEKERRVEGGDWHLGWRREARGGGPERGGASGGGGGRGGRGGGAAPRDSCPMFGDRPTGQNANPYLSPHKEAVRVEGKSGDGGGAFI